jgi:hypothetical protein
MSADKRKVSTDALETLGTIIGPGEKRDAIHLAVLPVVAGERLYPGQAISARDGIAMPDAYGIGIVDPFLGAAVEPEEHFWMVIKPRLITSLRHVWTHPAFPDEPGAEAPATPKPDKEASERWLRDFCERSDCPGYEAVMAAAVDGGDGEYLHFYGRDAHGEIPPEFWGHVEVVTGQGIAKENRADWFSCSC